MTITTRKLTAEGQRLVSASYKYSKIPNYLYGGGGGSGVWDELPTFDAASKSAKTPNSLMVGEGVQDQLPTFDAESKSGKIPNSLGGGGWGSACQSNFIPNFQNLSPNLNFLFVGVGGEGGLVNTNLWC